MKEFPVLDLGEPQNIDKLKKQLIDYRCNVYENDKSPGCRTKVDRDTRGATRRGMANAGLEFMVTQSSKLSLS